MINETALRAFMEQRNKNRVQFNGDTLWYRLPSDTTKITLLFLPPSHGNENIYGVYYYQHWINAKEINAIPCFKTYAMECPMCTFLDNYMNHKETIKPYLKQDQCKMNILILDDPSYEKRYKKPLDPKMPHLLTGPGSFQDWFMKELIERFTRDKIDISNPNQAYAYYIERERDEGPITKSIKPIPMKIGDNPEEQFKILDKCVNLVKLYKIDDAQIKRMKDCILIVKDVIENKMMTMSSPGGQFDYSANAAVQAPPSPQPQKPIYNPAAAQQEAYAQKVSRQGFEAPPPAHMPPLEPGYSDSLVEEYPGPQTTVLPPARPTAPIAPRPSQESNVTQMPQAGPMTRQGTAGAKKYVPFGAPVCFGDQNVYDGKSDQCRQCATEFLCKTEVKRQTA